MVHYIEKNGTRYWLNTKASKNRSTGYYHAALVLNACYEDSTFKGLKMKPITYKSTDQFLDIKTARKHAELWANESKQFGYITQA